MGSMYQDKLSAIFKAVWLFCSYLFWPRFRAKEQKICFNSFVLWRKKLPKIYASTKNGI